jgi:Spy/CpxP family protein refolding chaperone
MNSRITRWSGLLAAVLLGVGSHVALAEPGGGMAHGPGQGLAIEQVIAALKDQLNLNTSQQVMWDNAVARTRAARGQGRASMEQVHAALNAELAKAEPDFAAVATLADQAQANNQALRKQVRDEWLRLYATFSPAQKAVVREAVKAKVARMESFRDKMRQRFESRPQS